MKIESFLTFRLKVENLSRSVNWQDLKDLFRWGGEVTYAEAHVVIKYFQTNNQGFGSAFFLRIRIRILGLSGGGGWWLREK